ncbi:unnamed protein product [Rodentolepis nana]|uniref:Reverse transcriptase domain-containing protein n=1 Tax=Rodentolepis nana TaxID=102285 RepID=A0A0R3TEE8_RODNA|nr:unnamed protein product [Rodentolepis nana]
MVISDMSKAFEEVPGLKEIAPKDVGGDCKYTFEEICEGNDSVLRNIPAIAEEWNIAVDESKRPQEGKYSFGTYKDLPKDAMGTAGTYVKLNDEI